MEPHLTFVLFVASLFAGLLGSMSGLGGGLIIVPILLYGFGVPLPYAVGASLLCVIATSVASTAFLLPRGLTHLNLSVFLETGSVLGAIFGASIATFIPTKAIAILFSIVLFYASYQGFWGSPRSKTVKEKGHSPPLDLAFTYEGQVDQVHHPFIGWFLMTIGGVLSGLLGIGSGSFNVVVLERLMGLPLLVATATSSSMIGVTAAAGAWIYWEKGLIDPVLIFSLIPGILMGSFAGAYLLNVVPKKFIRLLFSTLVLAIACRMLGGALL